MPTARRSPLFTATALPWVVLGGIWFVSVGRMQHWDYLVFVQAASAVLHGQTPYVSLGSSALYGGHAFVYPWLVAFLFAPLSLLPGHAADVLFFVLSGAAVIGGCRLAGLRDPLSVVVVLSTQTAVRGFEVGSLNALLFLACVIAWVQRDRAAWVAGGLTVAIGTKLFLVPLAGWLVATSRWRALVLTSGGVGAVFAVSLLLGPVSLGEYVAMLRVLAQHEGVQGLSLYRLLAHQLNAPSAHALCAGAAAGLGGAGLIAGRLRRPSAELLSFGCFLVAAMVLTPVLWSHYILLTLVPVVLVRPRRTVLVMVCVLSWAIVAVAHGLWSIWILHACWAVLLIWLLVRDRRARTTALAVERDEGREAAVPALV